MTWLRKARQELGDDLELSSVVVVKDRVEALCVDHSSGPTSRSIRP
jgi:hypothetical protein